MIEEAEDEDASANPYGRGISPGAAAGDKIFFSQTLTSLAKEINTPKTESDSHFFDNLSKRVSSDRPLQTPQSRAGHTFDIGFTRNSEGKEKRSAAEE